MTSRYLAGPALFPFFWLPQPPNPRELDHLKKGEPPITSRATAWKRWTVLATASEFRTGSFVQPQLGSLA